MGWPATQGTEGTAAAVQSPFLWHPEGLKVEQPAFLFKIHQRQLGNFQLEFPEQLLLGSNKDACVHTKQTKPSKPSSELVAAAPR